MKNILSIIIFLLSELAFGHIPEVTVSSSQSGALIPGIIGVRDYANPGQDGLFIIDYNTFLKANSYYNRDGVKVDAIQGSNGNTIPLDVDISGYVNSLMWIYATPKLNFLGNAQYLFIATPNYSTAGIGVGLGELQNGETVKGGASGFGDLNITPLMLSWTLNKIDFTGAYSFFAPTGKYKTGADDNVGLGYWSHLIQWASYFYPKPDKSTAILLIPSYEFHGKIKDADVTPGSRLILEYGVSQYLSERLEVTLQGGHAWQIGEDSGSDVYWDTSVKDQMSTFGVGVSYWLLSDKLYANAKYTFSYGLKQHFKTNFLQFQIMYIPGIFGQEK